MIQRKIILIMMMAYITGMYASPSFYIKRLSVIAKSIELVLPDTLKPAQDYDNVWIYKGRMLRVRTNDFGDVVHIGYKLFDHQLASHYTPREALDFIERYALEQDLDIDKEAQERKKLADNVKCTQGSLSMLAKVTPDTPVTIDKIEHRKFRVKWSLGAHVLEFYFPVDYQSIIGANTIELEEVFERNIKRVLPIIDDNLLVDWENVKVVHSGNLLIANEGTYLNDSIRSDIFLKENSVKRTLILDSKMPVYSVKNILLTGVFPDKIPLRLTIDCYGYRKKQVDDISLQQFIGLCQLEKCEMYVGIKTYNPEEITAVVFALNREMAYNHVLSVRFPLGLLQGESISVTGTVYTYIPLQNVTEKFFTQDLNN